MILCEKCGRIIQSYEVKYRMDVEGRRRTLCAEDAKDVLKAQEGGASPKAAVPKPVPGGATPTAPGAAPAAAAAPAPGTAGAGPPKFTPEELAARKKAALEKAAAMKAQQAGGAPPS